MVKWLLKAGTVALGSLLGSACGSTASEYGVPNARYKLDGTVASRATATPLQSIQVILGDSRGFVSNPEPAGAADSQGRWSIDATRLPCDSSCQLVAHDPGDAPGGPFADAVVTIDPARTASGSGCNEGTFEQHGIAIQLDKK